MSSVYHNIVDLEFSCSIWNVILQKNIFRALVKWIILNSFCWKFAIPYILSQGSNLPSMSRSSHFYDGGDLTEACSLIALTQGRLVTAFCRRGSYVSEVRNLDAGVGIVTAHPETWPHLRSTHSRKQLSNFSNAVHENATKLSLFSRVLCKLDNGDSCWSFSIEPDQLSLIPF